MKIDVSNKVFVIIGLSLLALIVMIGATGIIVYKVIQDDKRTNPASNNTSKTSSVNCSLYMDYIPNNPSPCASKTSSNSSQGQSGSLTVSPAPSSN